MYSYYAIVFAFICAEMTTLVLNADNDQNPDLSNDAQRIHQAGTNRNEILLEIFPNRNFQQCQEIHKEYTKINGKPLVNDISSYEPRNGDTIFEDILFAKIYGPEMMKLTFLKSVFGGFYRGRANVLSEILILEDKNRPALIASYNHHAQKPFFDEIMDNYIDDYQHYLHQLYNRTREDGDDEPNPQEVDDQVVLLNKERKEHDSWDDHRNQLETVLLNKRVKFAVAVIHKYAESNHGNLLRDDVGKKIEDGDLCFGYQGLIDFLLDPYAYMARLIFDSADRYRDKKTTCIIIIVGNSENGELPKINDAFIKAYGKSIDVFLLENEKDDMARRMLAAIVVHSTQSPSSPPK